MYKRFLVGLLLLWPTAVPAADPDRDGESADSRATATEALRAKQAEAEDLQIERLRRLAGEPRININVRVRVIVVSLTNLQNRGFGWALPVLRGDQEATDTDGLFTMLAAKRVAKVKADEVLTIADGCQARLRAATEQMPTRLGEEAAENRDTFQGTEISVTPRWQRDGRLLIELVSEEACPASHQGGDPQEVTTTVELVPGKAIVLKGGKEERYESSSRGILPGLSRETLAINEIQTFIVVSREPRLAARPVTPARVR